MGRRFRNTLCSSVIYLERFFCRKGLLAVNTPKEKPVDLAKLIRLSTIKENTTLTVLVIAQKGIVGEDIYWV